MKSISAWPIVHLQSGSPDMLTTSLIRAVWASGSPESMLAAVISAVRIYILAAFYGAAFLALFIPLWLAAVALAVILGVAA